MGRSLGKLDLYQGGPALTAHLLGDLGGDQFVHSVSGAPTGKPGTQSCSMLTCQMRQLVSDSGFQRDKGVLLQLLVAGLVSLGGTEGSPMVDKAFHTHMPPIGEPLT